MLKKMACFAMMAMLSVSMMTACSAEVDEPCMYCNNSPSREYKKSDGTKAYICEKCSSTCMICNREDATKHYESLLGIIFACDDCYQMATGQ